MNKIKALYQKYQEIINYLIVGVLTTIVSVVVYFALTRTVLDYHNDLKLQIANIISWICAVIFAYVTNRIFVFNSKSKNIVKEFILFVIARILSLLMDMMTMYIVVSLIGLSDLIGKLISQVVVTIANYLFSKLIVFKKKKDSK